MFLFPWNTQGFAHRDIKCENILLNKDKSAAKLTDFGYVSFIVGLRLYSATFLFVKKALHALALSARLASECSATPTAAQLVSSNNNLKQTPIFSTSSAYVAPEVLKSQPYNPLVR